MRKKLINSIVIILCYIVLCARVQVYAEDNEFIPVKKIVSIVYDDSGSMMYDNKWAEANYSIQAFAGLLNSQDEIYITFMSDYESGAKRYTLDDPQKTAEQIRDEDNEFGYTPMESVKVAMDQLKAVQESDGTTQYWLVVLTDGDMQPGSLKYKNISEMLNDYKGTKMDNGSTVNIVYMAIGTDAASVKPDAKNGLMSFDAGEDVVPTLSEISNIVSGRLRFDDKNIRKIDGHTYELETKLPLYAISVFSQSSEAEVNDVSAETKMHIDRNVKLRYPEARIDAETDESLIGNVCMIDNDGKVMPPGKYTVTFSEDVDPAKTVFMYQMAIDMDVVVERNGTKIEDYTKLNPGDKVDVILVPVNPETGEEIDESLLPDDISWKISYQAGGNVIKENDSNKLKDVELSEGDGEFHCTMQIPGYAPTLKIIDFTIEGMPEYGIEVEQPDDLKYSRSSLKIDGSDDGSAVKFYITRDGERLSKEEAKAAGLEVADIKADNSKEKGLFKVFGIFHAGARLELNDDGSYTLYPSNLLKPAVFITPGEYEVTVQVKRDASVQAVGKYSLYASLRDVPGLFQAIIILLVVLYILYVIFLKTKFNNQTVFYEKYEAGFGRTGVQNHGLSDATELRKFSPAVFLPIPVKKSFYGIILYPNRDGGVYFKRSQAEKAYKYHGASGGNPLTTYSSINSRIRKANHEGEPDKVILDAYYFCNETDGLHQLKIQ